VEIDRYHRQVLLPQVGRSGQDRLARARVLLVGCGALGSVIAEQLVRAGIGFLRVVDRDVVELTNLQRQVLFDEEDARQGLPKAVAAAERLRRVNSSVTVEPIVADVHSGNVERWADVAGGEARADVILDGTDNVETRYLLNDVAVKHGVPWVYGACVGTEGRVLAVDPSRTPCLRCVFPVPPGAGELPTCDTAGVLGPVAAIVGALQAMAAMRLLLGDSAGSMIALDGWSGRFRTLDVSRDRQHDCPCCGQRRFEFLEHRSAGGTTSLCGRDAVQVTPKVNASIDLKAMASKLGSAAGDVEATPFLVRCHLAEPAGLHLTIFADGRLIVKGTTSSELARSVYARYVGS
jgi:molybdopterin/thiamine biosynthesis adenylyltransferase